MDTTKSKVNNNVKDAEHYVIKNHTFYHIKNGKGFDTNYKGFSVWKGGCGIGHAKDKEGARKLIFDYSKQCLEREIKEMEEKIALKKETLQALGNDSFNLGIFKNPNYHGYECNHFNGKEG